jgi:hypothetical protein
MRWNLAGACALALGMTTGCPEDFGKGGRMDRAAHRDTEELLEEKRCSKAELARYCGPGRENSVECIRECGG